MPLEQQFQLVLLPAVTPKGYTEADVLHLAEKPSRCRVRSNGERAADTNKGLGSTFARNHPIIDIGVRFP